MPSKTLALLRPRWGLTPIRRMYLAGFCLGLSWAVANAIFPPFVQALGYDLSSVGLLVAVFGVLSLLSRLPTGALTTAHFAGLLILGSGLLLAASIAAYPVATDFAGLAALRALHGLAHGVLTTFNLVLLMAALERRAQRASVTGWYLGWLAAAYALGNYVSGFLVDLLGYGPTFSFAAVAGLAALPLLTHPGSLGAPRSAAASLGPAARPAAAPGATPSPAAPPPTTPASSTTRAWPFLLSLPLLVPTLQAFSINGLSQLMWVLYPLYGLGVGLSLTAVGLHRGVYSTATMITRPMVGQWGHLGHGRLATGGLVATATLTLLVPLLTAFGPLLVLNVVLGALRSTTLVASMVAAVEYAGADARKRGWAAGMYNFGTDVGNVLAPLLGGLVADRIGLGPAFWAMSAFFLAVYLALLAASAVAARRVSAE